MACVSPYPADDEVREELTVLGEVEPDPSRCDEEIEARPGEDDIRGLPLLPWDAVALEGSDGQVYTVQFALDAFPEGLFVPGDLVSLSVGPPASGGDPNGSGTGLSVSRDGHPLALVAYYIASSTPEFSVVPAIPVCTDDAPSLPVNTLIPMRVSANCEVDVIYKVDRKVFFWLVV
jgi:hypothetical protein